MSINPLISQVFSEFAGVIPHLGAGMVLGEALDASAGARAVVAGAAQREVNERTARLLEASGSGLGQLGHSRRPPERSPAAVLAAGPGAITRAGPSCTDPGRRTLFAIDDDPLDLSELEARRPWEALTTVAGRLTWLTVLLDLEYAVFSGHACTLAMTDSGVDIGNVFTNRAKHLHYAKTAIDLALASLDTDAVEAWVYLLIALDHLYYEPEWSLGHDRPLRTEVELVRRRLEDITGDMAPTMSEADYGRFYQFGSRLIREILIIYWSREHRYIRNDTVFPDTCTDLRAPLGMPPGSILRYVSISQERRFIRHYLGLTGQSRAGDRRAALDSLTGAVRAKAAGLPSYALFFAPFLCLTLETAAASPAAGKIQEVLEKIAGFIPGLPDGGHGKHTRQGAKDALETIRRHIDAGRSHFAIGDLEEMKSAIEKRTKGGVGAYVHTSLCEAIDELMTLLRRSGR